MPRPVVYVVQCACHFCIGEAGSHTAVQTSHSSWRPQPHPFSKCIITRQSPFRQALAKNVQQRWNMAQNLAACHYMAFAKTAKQLKLAVK